MENLQELLEELNNMIDPDPRCRGTYPQYEALLDKVSEIFADMDEMDLKELVYGMDELQQEEVSGALMDLDYDWAAELVQEIDFR